MAYDYEYPYTNPYRYNDDWLLSKMKKLTEWIDGTAAEQIAQYIDNYFNQIMIGAIYDESTETIILSKEET